MNEKDIIDAYVNIRETNHTVSDYVLDYMKASAIEGLRVKELDSYEVATLIEGLRVKELDSYEVATLIEGLKVKGLDSYEVATLKALTDILREEKAELGVVYRYDGIELRVGDVLSLSGLKEGDGFFRSSMGELFKYLDADSYEMVVCQGDFKDIYFATSIKKDGVYATEQDINNFQYFKKEGKGISDENYDDKEFWGRKWVERADYNACRYMIDSGAVVLETK